MNSWTVWANDFAKDFDRKYTKLIDADISEVFEKAVATDDGFESGQMYSLYQSCNEDERAAIDAALVHICGYSYPTLIAMSFGETPGASEWNVSVSIAGHADFTVEADSEEDARKTAQAEFDKADFGEAEIKYAEIKDVEHTRYYTGRRYEVSFDVSATYQTAVNAETEEKALAAAKEKAKYADFGPLNLE